MITYRRESQRDMAREDLIELILKLAAAHDSTANHRIAGDQAGGD
jgi:hypothetical protein